MRWSTFRNRGSERIGSHVRLDLIVIGNSESFPSTPCPARRRPPPSLPARDERRPERPVETTLWPDLLSRRAIAALPFDRPSPPAPGRAGVARLKSFSLRGQPSLRQSCRRADDR